VRNDRREADPKPPCRVDPRLRPLLSMSAHWRNQYDPLISPALLRHEVPVPPAAKKTISSSRRTAAAIVAGTDPLHRLLVVVGPCSIHDVDQAKEYASKLRKGVTDGRWAGLEIVMRVYLCVA